MVGPDVSADRHTVGADRSPLLLSLVVPAFNEASRLGDGLARLLGAMENGAIDAATTEVIVVDDGSTDGTAAEAATLLASLPHVRIVTLAENRGKGAAVRAGVAIAAAPFITFADADMAIDPNQMPQFLAALSGADLAIGSRAASGASVDRPSIRRSVMNRVFNQTVNALTRVSLDDTQCGFKAFRAPAAKLLFQCSVTDRFAFDVEVLSLSRRLGLTIAQVPVQWLRVKGSRVRPWSDAVSMVRDVVRASRHDNSVSPVHAITVKLPSEGEAEHAPTIRSLVAPGLPVVEQPGGMVLVLCPLMAEADIEATATLVRAELPHAMVERTVRTFAQLRALAPLSSAPGTGGSSSVPA
jgi:hypothetical protein